MHPYYGNSGQNSNRVQDAAHALTSALTNPYGYTFQHAPHYAQAYSDWPASGHASPSTLGTHPIAGNFPSQAGQQHARQSSGGAHHPNRHQPRRGGTFSQRPRQPQTHWYEPGNDRCTYQQCTFTGSKYSVEMHMMDRHLIFPPGWDKRKQNSGWDADPSLKNGKPIPIQGTGVTLNTPEAISAWIADRKKRFPTAAKVEEKTKKVQDAVARGEIAVTEMSLRGRKRAMMDEHTTGRGQKRTRGGGKPHDTLRARQVHPLPKKPEAVSLPAPKESDDVDSSSDSDIDPEKDAISSKKPVAPLIPVPESTKVCDEPTSTGLASALEAKNVKQQLSHVRRPTAQPRPPPKNPFGNRPSFLRNLLQPEIRMTVSNLSQVIRFLVENDFLENVELKPGEAEEKRIEVIGDSTHSTNSSKKSNC